jgi:hypothetical protein
MKMTKLTVALAVSGFLGLASVAHAITTPTPVSLDTYVFTADPDSDNTDFNGSTITIGEYPAGPDTWDAVTAFSFYDRYVSTTPFTSGYASGSDVTSYGPTGWEGNFWVAISGNVDWKLFSDGFEFDAHGGPDYLDAGALDPSGTWTYEPAVSAPDASSTFPMLLGVMAALMGAHYCNRPRVLALARR